MDIKQWAQEQADKLDARDLKRQKHSRHTWMYKDHFEGYQEFGWSDEKGRLKIKLVYTADYYRLALDGAEKALTYAAYIILWLIAAAAVFVAATRYIPINSNWYAAIPEVISIGGLGWFAVGIFYLICAKEKRLIRQYKGQHFGMLIGGIITLAGTVISLAVTAVYGIVVKWGPGYTVSVICLFIASVIMAGLTWWSQKNITYTMIKNEHPDIPAGASAMDLE